MGPDLHQDPYVFGPPGSASGSFSHKSSSKNSKKNLDFLLFYDFFLTVPDLNPYVFGPPGSASGSVRQRYGSADPDPDLYQNVTDPQHWFYRKNMLLLCSISSVRKSRPQSTQTIFSMAGPPPASTVAVSGGRTGNCHAGMPLSSPQHKLVR